MKKMLLVAALFTAGGPAIGSELVIRASAPEPLHESVSEQVNISGSVIVGVARRDALSGRDVLEGVQVPAGSPRFCMIVRSRDGVYFARNTFDAPSAQSAERIELAMSNSRNQDLLHQLDDDSISVGVREGACEAAQGIWLVATSRAQHSDFVDVLINGADATSVFWVIDGLEGECEPFAQGRSTAYNVRCAIPANRLAGSSTAVVIERERFGRPLPKVTLTVRSP